MAWDFSTFDYDFSMSGRPEKNIIRGSGLELDPRSRPLCTGLELGAHSGAEIDLRNSNRIWTPPSQSICADMTQDRNDVREFLGNFMRRFRSEGGI